MVYEVDIFENGTLVLRHSFFGKTGKEALRYAKAHMKTDEFFRAAIEKGTWHGITLDVEERWRETSR